MVRHTGTSSDDAGAHCRGDRVMGPCDGLRQGDDMKKVTREELKAMMDRSDPFILLDARGGDAFRTEHLPGAVSVPSDRVGRHILPGLKEDDTIVTYCSSFDCEASTVAAEKLEKYGFKKVLEFKGGLKDWKGAGYATER